MKADRINYLLELAKVVATSHGGGETGRYNLSLNKTQSAETKVDLPAAVTPTPQLGTQSGLGKD